MGGEAHNSSGLPPFILTGLPGMETSQHWLFLLLGVLYTVSIVGNALILFIIKEEESLHQPMYYFLSLLSLNDLGVSFSTLTTVLGVFCFLLREISFNSCMSQMFFIHLFSFMESGILLAMSFDRYVAICNPLHYSTVLTDARVMWMGVCVFFRSFCMIFPLPFLLKRLPFCKANVLSHAYCLHPDMIRLPCGDITINNIFGLFIVISTFGLDSALILLSYVLILRSVLAIASREERLKTLNTCVSHLCAVLIFYVPMVGVSMAARYGRHAPRYVHTLLSLVYLFVPPMLNPVIYSIKTKEIRRRLHKILLGTKI
ncbi:olfactory receptor family 51 subfamily A member 42 [Mus musculus]|jgi:olfactory receptor|uniref:Olfactory receptor n=1 Tax=Mus musculus TaxID=10090 RepID=Q8VGY1_MOUSE|nr:olfactory receptor family 51 subfamily A member 42 [Mus musculus]AAI06804.1 Olfactory receptor 643 [Mus musculus]AAL60672.1 olfactory receptor MOR13-2 [Mus musculus]AAP71118.1 olfactory receptor Olfr643 [Mus musculus]EDL16706.1 mCG141445 [Mus musculus]|eukprot:NP_667288.1 olfactory receptor 643 [Mus musculus]